jgi:peroxiredoxin
MKTLLLLGVAAAVVLVVVGYRQWSYLSTLSEMDRLSATSGYPIVGRTAPGFSLPDLAGGAGDLAGYAGRPVVIDFWTTWCGLCVKEFPVFQEFYRTYGDRMGFLSICSGSSGKRAAEMAAEKGITFPVLYDGEKVVARAYQPAVNRMDRQVTIFPFTVFVDAQGRVVYAKAGIFRSLDELVSLLRRLGFPVDAPPS